MTPWPVARQAPLSMGFSRQEHWRRLPFPSPWDLLNPELEPASPTSLASQELFTTGALGMAPHNPEILILIGSGNRRQIDRLGLKYKCSTMHLQNMMIEELVIKSGLLCCFNHVDTELSMPK